MSDLTIARSLRRAKQLRGEIATLTERIKGSTFWKKGEDPDFQYEDLMTARDRAVTDLTSLRAGIARANAANTLVYQGHELSLAEAVLTLGELKGKAVLLKEIVLRHGEHRIASHVGWDDEGRRVGAEVTVYQAVMTEPERAAKLDELRGEIDALNELLEEANHRTTV